MQDTESGGGGGSGLLEPRALPGEDGSFHQAAIYAQHAEDPGTQRQLILGLASLMTATQCLCVCGALGLTLWASCESNDQCLDNPGQFCGFGARGAGASPCAWCGTWAPLDIEFNADGTTYNFPEDQDHFAGFNPKTAAAVCRNANRSFAITPPPGHGLHPNPSAFTCLDYSSETAATPKMCAGASELGMPSPRYKEYVEAWCERCVDPITGTVDGMTAWLLPADNIDAMGFASCVDPGNIETSQLRRSIIVEEIHAHAFYNATHLSVGYSNLSRCRIFKSSLRFSIATSSGAGICASR